MYHIVPHIQQSSMRKKQMGQASFPYILVQYVWNQLAVVPPGALKEDQSALSRKPA